MRKIVSVGDKIIFCFEHLNFWQSFRTQNSFPKKNCRKKNFFFSWLVVVTSNIDPYVIEWLIAHRVPNPLISFWHHFIPNTSTNPYMYHTCIMYQIPTNGKLSNPICVSFFVQYISIAYNLTVVSEWLIQVLQDVW